MSSLFGQVWLWSLLSFAAGVALTWLVLVRPAKRQLEEAEDRLLTAPRPTATVGASGAAGVSGAPDAAVRDRDDWHVESSRSLVDDVLAPEPPRYDPVDLKRDQLLEELDDEHRPLSDFEEEHDFPELEEDRSHGLFDRLGPEGRQAPPVAPGRPEVGHPGGERPGMERSFAERRAAERSSVERATAHHPSAHPSPVGAEAEDEPELPVEETHLMPAVPVAEVAPRGEEPTAPPEVEVFQPREVWREETAVQEVYEPDEIPGRRGEEDDEPEPRGVEETTLIPATELARAIAEVDREEAQVWPEHDLTGHFTPVEVEDRGGPETDVLKAVPAAEPVGESAAEPAVEPAVEPAAAKPATVESTVVDLAAVDTAAGEPAAGKPASGEPRHQAPEPRSLVEPRHQAAEPRGLTEPRHSDVRPAEVRPADPEPFEPTLVEPTPAPADPEPFVPKFVEPEEAQPAPLAKRDAPAAGKEAPAAKTEEPSRPRSLFEPLVTPEAEEEAEPEAPRPAAPQVGNDQPFVPKLAPELLASSGGTTKAGLPQRPVRRQDDRRTPPPPPPAQSQAQQPAPPLTPPPARPVRPRPVGFSPSTGGRPASGSTRYRSQEEGFNPRSPFGPGSVLPKSDGLAPAPEFQVKATLTGRRYFTSESANFRETRADVWFRTTADAEKAGFRQAP